MASQSTSVGQDYMFDQSVRDSMRLHYQHLMWNARLGYLLHPSIPNSAAPHRVADIGAGNGCWLLELSQQVSSDWQLDGFDVSTAQFPAPEFLPPNVTLTSLDAFGNLPVDLVAKFDIVHVRAFCVVVKKGDPGPLMANLIKLLRPGGYLQWDDWDPASFIAYAPNDTVSTQHSSEIIQVWHRFAENLDLKMGWLSKLVGIFHIHGLEVLDSLRIMLDRSPGSSDNHVRKAATDNWMMNLEESGRVITQRGGPVAMTMTPEEWHKLLGKAVGEAQQGVNLWIDFIVVVGRKVDG